MLQGKSTFKKTLNQIRVYNKNTAQKYHYVLWYGLVNHKFSHNKNTTHFNILKILRNHDNYLKKKTQKSKRSASQIRSAMREEIDIPNNSIKASPPSTRFTHQEPLNLPWFTLPIVNGALDLPIICLTFGQTPMREERRGPEWVFSWISLPSNQKSPP